MVDIAEVMIRIIGDPSGLSNAAAKAKGELSNLESSAKTSFSNIEGSAKSSFDNVGKGASSFSNIGNMAAVGFGAAAVAIGAFALKSAADVGGAYKQIQGATGATGATLDSLKESFRNVFGTVPQDASTVASAIDVLNQKLGLTGPTLDTLSKQLLDLSRITGTDVTTNATNAASSFKAWGVAAQNMGPELDALYELQTKTGTSVATTSDLLAKAAGPAMAAGMSYNQTAVMMAEMAAAGLPARQSVSMLTTATDNATKSGKDAGTEWNNFIQRLSNPAYKVTADDIKEFGANTEKFANVVQKTGGNWKDLANQMAGSSGLIESTSDSTLTFSQRLDIFKNKLEVAFAPLGSSIIALLTSFLNMLTPILPIITALVQAFTSLPMPLQMVGMGFAALVGGVGAANLVLGKFGFSLKDLPGDIEKVIPQLKSFAQALAGGDVKGAFSSFSSGKVAGGAATAEQLPSVASAACPDPACFDKVLAKTNTEKDALGDVKTAASDINPVVEDTSGAVEEVATKGGFLSGIFDSLPGPLSSLAGMIPGIGAGLGEAGVAAEGVGVGVAGGAESGGLMAAAIGLIGPALVPVLAILAPIVALFGVLYATSNTFRTSVGALVDQFKSLLGWVGELVGDLTSLNFSKLGSDLISGFTGGFNTIKNDIMGFPGMMVTSIEESATTIGGIADKIGGMIIGAFASLKNIDWGGAVSGLFTTLTGSATAFLNAILTLFRLVNWLQIFTLIFSNLTAFTQAITAGFQKIDWGAAFSGVASALGNALSGAGGALGGIGSSIGGALSSAGGALGGLGDTLDDVLTQALNWDPTPMVNNIINAVGGAFDSLMSLLGSIDWSSVANSLITAIGAAFDSLFGGGGGTSTAGSSVSNGMSTALTQGTEKAGPDILGKLGDIFLKLLELVPDIFAKIAIALGEAIMKIDWGSVFNSAATAFEKIDWGKMLTGGLGSAGAASGDIGTSVGNAIKTAVSSFGSWLLSAAATFFTGLPGKITAALVGFGTWLWNAAADFIANKTWQTKISAAITGFAAWLWTAATDFVSNKTWATKLSAALVGFGTWLWNAAVDFVSNATWAGKMTGALIGLGTWLWTAAVDFVTNATWASKLAAALVGLGQWLWDAAVDFVSNSTWAGKMATALQGLGDWMTTAAQSFFDNLSTKVQGAVGTLQSAIGAAQTAYNNLVNRKSTGPTTSDQQLINEQANNPYAIAPAGYDNGAQLGSGGILYLMNDAAGAAMCPTCQQMIANHPGASIVYNAGQNGYLAPGGTSIVPAAEGAIVAAQTGGVPVLLAEEGKPELVVPYDLWEYVDPYVFSVVPTIGGSAGMTMSPGSPSYVLPQLAGGGIVPAPGQGSLVDSISPSSVVSTIGDLADLMLNPTPSTLGTTIFAPIQSAVDSVFNLENRINAINASATQVSVPVSSGGPLSIVPAGPGGETTDLTNKAANAASAATASSEGVIDSIISAASSLINSVATIGGNIMTGLKDIGNLFTTDTTTAATTTAATTKTAAQQTTTATETGAGALLSELLSLFNVSTDTKTAITNGFTSLSSVISTLSSGGSSGTGIFGDVSGLISGIAQIFTGGISLIMDLITMSSQASASTTQSFYSGGSAYVRTSTPTVAPVTESTIKGDITTIVGGVTSSVKSGFGLAIDIGSLVGGLAGGGIVNGPMIAVLGENNRRELVTPLDGSTQIGNQGNQYNLTVVVKGDESNATVKKIINTYSKEVRKKEFMQLGM